ncbi:hypothetical protein JL2886_01437 [Phaeobacter gallaeciensis]|uniref:Uncharacterized protein n=1 Tax=Phaeobacter gallaeciensis TaxID=60890 RepID=A0A1B0ZQK0_9RHOB|nr:hypothetical protein JL2886_01437 [Phaeobacter gallaeciensis]
MQQVSCAARIRPLFSRAELTFFALGAPLCSSGFPHVARQVARKSGVAVFRGG